MKSGAQGIKGFRDVPLNTLRRMARAGLVRWVCLVKTWVGYGKDRTLKHTGATPEPNAERRQRKATGLSPRQYRRATRKSYALKRARKAAA